MADLLEDKSITLPKALSAGLVAITIVGSIYWFLSEVATELEQHFHIWSHTPKQLAELQIEVKQHPAMMIAMIMTFPFFGIMGIVLVLPLGVYVTDHAAFQNLNVLRPDHYMRLLVRVYKALIADGDGKLKGKNL